MPFQQPLGYSHVWLNLTDSELEPHAVLGTKSPFFA